MLFYVSLADVDSGQFVGGVVLNVSDETEAVLQSSVLGLAYLTAHALPFPAFFAARCVLVPVGACLPASFMGRVLSLAEVAELDPERLVKHVRVGFAEEVETVERIDTRGAVH